MVSEYIDETILYESLESHFVNGIDWTETKLYEALQEHVSEGTEVWHGCTTVADIDRRCQRLDSLYESIATHGYRTQSELREPNPSFDEPFGFLNERINEISIDIARDGEMMLLDNRHRLIIAQLLDLDRVPVSVIVRHKEWVEQCEEHYQNRDMLDHPDYRYWLDN
ncbi:hypothetical protein C500_17141 [Natrialba magadii ATCC 43099]|nr:hypothetical protein C500_17141 [Natrialba magadii ATCC 43099]